MKRRTGQPATDQPIRSASRKLVATRHASGPRRKRSEYDSSDRLPGIEELFDRTVQQIQRIHLVRKRSHKTFDRLWERVCGKLAELGNASAYARWKQDDITRNLDQLQKLDAAAEEAWAASLTPLNPDVRGSRFVLDDRQFQRLREEHSGLKPDIEISIDHVLEVAIAYWIEAMNAHMDGDELRAMHALIQCHFHLGISHALRMTHDAKADGGRQSGQKERDALAEVVFKVMENFTIDRSIHNEDFLFGKISEVIAADPVHADVLRAYDKWASSGKTTQGSLVDRLPETLMKWVSGKEQPYPKLTVQFRRLTELIQSQRLSKTRLAVKPTAS